MIFYEATIKNKFVCVREVVFFRPKRPKHIYQLIFRTGNYPHRSFFYDTIHSRLNIQIHHFPNIIITYVANSEKKTQTELILSVK